jgi:diphosphomevalonate decarboxylase
MKTTFRCPSNIALVKYWGKKEGGIQLPANPSISLTLSDLYAETTVEVTEPNSSGKASFEFLFNGKARQSFEPKLHEFFARIYNDYELLQKHHLVINSTNNFPHGTGIASSAAGFGALACCVYELQQKLYPKPNNKHHEISRIARLGSGSACRSMYAEPAIWGKHVAFDDSCDDYAVPYLGELAVEFENMMDAVLIVDAGEKKVSSSAGHGLLKNNPYGPARFEEAGRHLRELCECFKTGEVHKFIAIVESEALQLHAMMMLSNPYFILMRPNTLAIIEKIWDYREKTGTPLMFTLDAGANVHLLFAGRYKQDVLNFIQSDLLTYCQNGEYFCSATGSAPIKINN